MSQSLFDCDCDGSLTDRLWFFLDKFVLRKFRFFDCFLEGGLRGNDFIGVVNFSFLFLFDYLFFQLLLLLALIIFAGFTVAACYLLGTGLFHLNNFFLIWNQVYNWSEVFLLLFLIFSLRGSISVRNGRNWGHWSCERGAWGDGHVVGERLVMRKEVLRGHKGRIGKLIHEGL